jgi:hypothetical protein
MNISREDRENKRKKIYEKIYKGENLDDLEMFTN